MDLMNELHIAFGADNAPAVRELFSRHPDLRTLVNAPIGPFNSPAVCNVRSAQMLDVLLEAGADINAKSQWWAGGFCLLDSASDDLAAHAIKRGATVEIHAAARLGLIPRLKELLAADRRLATARGGDGKTPLHFARTTQVAALLLEHGSDVNARDIDHESTASQHLILEHPEVSRFLIEGGGESDIFLAAALGDLALVRQHIAANADCLRRRINSESFPMRNPKAGGTIYNWTLGWHLSPQQVARKFGHEQVFNFLMVQSPPEVQLANWCWLGEEEEARKTLAQNPGVIAKLTGTDRRAMADAARNNETPAVLLMLDCGFPIDARGQHSATPLHWAAWHGNAAMLKRLLDHGAASLLQTRDKDFDGTPMRWAVHGSENGWNCAQGDYGTVVKALLAAGAKRPEKVEGSPAVREALS